jgi:hypothetical protein
MAEILCKNKVFILAQEMTVALPKLTAQPNVSSMFM